MPTDAQPAPRRRGPRTDGEDTRAAIVEAARAEFAAKGYDGATLRGIARSAGVDPRLVHHYFDGKQSIFQEVLHMPVQLDEVIEGVFTAGTQGLGERVVRTFLAVWDDPGANERLVTFVAASSSGTDTARSMQQFLSGEVLSRITRFARDDDPELRASLVASQLLGIAMARYVLRIEPFASADPDVLVPFLAPTIERYLNVDPEVS